MTQKKWKKSQNKIMEKIHGRFELDKKGEIKRDSLGKKIRKGFLQIVGKVDDSFRVRPWVGKYSQMVEMKAHRLKMNEKRLERLRIKKLKKAGDAI